MTIVHPAHQVYNWTRGPIGSGWTMMIAHHIIGGSNFPPFGTVESPKRIIDVEDDRNKRTDVEALALLMLLQHQ